MRVPDYQGGGLVNLVAELEHRLTGSSQSPRLEQQLRSMVAWGDSYILTLFDGLGDMQLRSHPAGARLAGYRVGGLDTSFSTQTSVATSTLATGYPPARHGLISYLLRLSEDSPPVNTLWWYRTDGSTPSLDLSSFLPAPNLAERLAAAGARAVVVEPAGYLGSPLNRVLYRGAETRGVEGVENMAETAVEEAAVTRTMVVCYLPFVDAAGHAAGTTSHAYREALDLVTSVWFSLGENLPPGVVLVGTADHGMIDVEAGKRVHLAPPASLRMYGDDRVIYVKGDQGEAARFATTIPGTWVPIEEAGPLWGPPPFHPELERRLPAGLIIADAGTALHYPGNDLLMVGYHGGLTEDELRIPLLVWDH